MLHPHPCSLLINLPRALSICIYIFTTKIDLLSQLKHKLVLLRDSREIISEMFAFTALELVRH